MQTITEVAPRLGVALTCAALGLPRATYYRHQQLRREPKPCLASVRALSKEEREQVLAVLHEPRFVHLAPAEEVMTTVTTESNLIRIEAVWSSCDADLEHEPPGILPGRFQVSDVRSLLDGVRDDALLAHALHCRRLAAYLLDA